MLVLTRKVRESVIVSDEVLVTVVSIRDTDGRRVFGAKVRLGFQSPRYVAIHRSDWRGRNSRTGFASERYLEPAPPLPGRLVEVPDAEVRLRIEVPPKIPVLCNGKPIEGHPSATTSDSQRRAGKTVHYVTFRKEDRVTICGNIAIVAAGVAQFIPLKREPATVG
jgi:carbon storage regulator